MTVDYVEADDDAIMIVTAGTAAGWILRDATRLAVSRSGYARLRELL